MAHKIEWCTHTINPFTGCTRGCHYCYARRMAHRWSQPGMGTIYERALEKYGNPFEPVLDTDLLERQFAELERARKPRRIFIGSMAEICEDRREINTGEFLPLRTVQKEIAARCAAVPLHTFLILTKRPEDLIEEWPANVQVGVSASMSAGAAHRLGLLQRRAKAGLLWISVEPLRVSLGFDVGALRGAEWVVIGAMTGHYVSVNPLRAAEEIVQWCASQNVPCFVKHSLRRLDYKVAWPMEFPGGRA